MFSMNFSKPTFADSSLSLFPVLSSESPKANISSFSFNGVNLSERCSFLLLISSFNSVWNYNTIIIVP